MKQLFYIVLVGITLTACKQVKKQQADQLNCQNSFTAEQMNVSLCLPSDNFNIEKSKNNLVLSPKENDSTTLSGVIFMIKADDFGKKLSSAWYRDEQLKEYQAHPEIDIEVLNKGNQIIDGKEFADLEIIIRLPGKKVYSRTLFYFEGTVGYLIDAIRSTYKINDDIKSDILSFFSTFKIDGPPNF